MRIVVVGLLILLAGCDVNTFQVVADVREGGVWIVSKTGIVEYCHVAGLDPKCRKE